jgi:hypothetical protein
MRFSLKNNRSKGHTYVQLKGWDLYSSRVGLVQLKGGASTAQGWGLYSSRGGTTSILWEVHCGAEYAGAINGGAMLNTRGFTGAMLNVRQETGAMLNM